MDLLRQAGIHLQPAYARWVAPLVLDNLAQARSLIKAGMEEGQARMPPDLASLLDETRGGFWALGMPEACQLAGVARDFAREATSLALVGDHLLWAVEWLDDTAFRANLGQVPPRAPLASLLRQWGHRPAAAQDHGEEEDEGAVPSARAKMALAQAFCQQGGEVRARLETWMSQDTVAPQALQSVLDDLGVLERALHGFAPALGPGIEGARDHLAGVAYATQTDSTATRTGLAQAALDLAQVEYSLPAVLLGGQAPDGLALARAEARGALEAVAGCLQEDIGRARLLLSGLHEEAAPLPAELGPLVLRLAGSMDMLDATSIAKALREAAGDAGRERGNHPALHEAMAHAEAWAMAATMHSPHVHPELLQAPAEPVPDRPPPAAPDAERWTQAPMGAQALEIHSGLGQAIAKWRRSPRVDATVAIRRGFQLLAERARQAGSTLDEALSEAAQDLLHEALLHLRGPSGQACDAVEAAHRVLGEEVGPDRDGMARGTLEKLAAAADAMRRHRAPGGCQRWEDLPAQSRDRIMDFLAPRWPILRQPEHPDFWVAFQLLEAALDMAGVEQMSRPLRADLARRELSGRGRDILSRLWEEAQAYRSLDPERIVAWMEEGARLAKQAVSRKDARALETLLHEQAQFLAEHGYFPDRP